MSDSYVQIPKGEELVAQLESAIADRPERLMDIGIWSRLIVI